MIVIIKVYQYVLIVGNIVLYKMVENKSFKINGIKLLLKKNYKIDPDTIDLNSRIDDKLSMSENWFNNIKPLIKG